MSIIGAYLSADILRGWTLLEATRWLTQLQGYGVNTIFSESDTYRWDIIKQTHDMGMQFMGGLTCFHSKLSRPLSSDLYPILANGQPRPKMNWYTGIIPTHKGYNATRLESLETMLAENVLDGVWLDFIRWPLHWEQELRSDTAPPLESSFDAHTLQLFVTFSDIEIPDGTLEEPANWIINHYTDLWIDFKCKIITDFVAEAKAIMQVQPDVKPLGMSIVPATPLERNRLLGQRVPELSKLADYISPMLYHHILGHSPAWIADKLDEFAAESDAKLLPYLQVNALGHDDENFPTHEWEAILDTVLAHKHTAGFIAFTGDALSTYQRGNILKNVLARTS